MYGFMNLVMLRLPGCQGVDLYHYRLVGLILILIDLTLSILGFYFCWDYCSERDGKKATLVDGVSRYHCFTPILDDLANA